MYRQITISSTEQDSFRTEADDLSLSPFRALEGPPAQLEHLPQGLIEDQL